VRASSSVLDIALRISGQSVTSRRRELEGRTGGDLGDGSRASVTTRVFFCSRLREPLGGGAYPWNRRSKRFFTASDFGETWRTAVVLESEGAVLVRLVEYDHKLGLGMRLR